MFCERQLSTLMRARSGPSHLVEHEHLVDSAVMPGHVACDAQGGQLDGGAELRVALPSLELQVDEHDGGRTHLRQILQRLVGVNLREKDE